MVAKFLTPFVFCKWVVAKILQNARPSLMRGCKLHRRSKVLSGSRLANVSIGRYSYCGYQCRITDTDIGAFCSISDYAAIGGAQHPMYFVSTSPVFSAGRNCLRANFAKLKYDRGGRTIIGNDVWIGYGVMIKSGVSIGNGAVIGMGSVVTKDVPAYEIWAGNPARRIRERFDATTVAELDQIQWWSMSEAELRAGAEFFNNVEKFIEWRGKI